MHGSIWPVNMPPPRAYPRNLHFFSLPGALILNLQACRIKETIPHPRALDQRYISQFKYIILRPLIYSDFRRQNGFFRTFLNSQRKHINIWKRKEENKLLSA